MKVECAVIQDLLPLYRDGATSPRTSQIVAEHLQECPACRTIFDEPDDPRIIAKGGRTMQNPEIVDYGRRIKARRRKIMLIVGSLIALLLLVIGGMGLFIYRVIWGDPPVVSSDPADYGKFDRFKGYGNLYVLPAKLPGSLKIDQYRYYYQDTIFDATYQVYLEYTLSEEDYRAEVARLAGISEERGGEVHRVTYDTEHFAYPAYVTIFENNLTYEYALVNEAEHKIVCVFTQFAFPKDILFDARYLPKNFQSPGDPGVNTLGGYNMYQFADGIGFYTDHKVRKVETPGR